jgi:hypothetical protein
MMSKHGEAVVQRATVDRISRISFEVAIGVVIALALCLATVPASAREPVKRSAHAPGVAWRHVPSATEGILPRPVRVILL